MKQNQTYTKFSELLEDKIDTISSQTALISIQSTIDYLKERGSYRGLSDTLKDKLDEYFNKVIEEKEQ